MTSTLYLGYKVILKTANGGGGRKVAEKSKEEPEGKEEPSKSEPRWQFKKETGWESRGEIYFLFMMTWNDFRVKVLSAGILNSSAVQRMEMTAILHPGPS